MKPALKPILISWLVKASPASHSIASLKKLTITKLLELASSRAYRLWGDYPAINTPLSVAIAAHRAARLERIGQLRLLTHPRDAAYRIRKARLYRYVIRRGSRLAA